MIMEQTNQMLDTFLAVVRYTSSYISCLRFHMYAGVSEESGWYSELHQALEPVQGRVWEDL